MMGYTGYVPFGNVVFFGLGAYTTGITHVAGLAVFPVDAGRGGGQRAGMPDRRNAGAAASRPLLRGGHDRFEWRHDGYRPERHQTYRRRHGIVLSNHPAEARRRIQVLLLPDVRPDDHRADRERHHRAQSIRLCHSQHQVQRRSCPLSGNQHHLLQDHDLDGQRGSDQLSRVRSTATGCPTSARRRCSGLPFL